MSATAGSLKKRVLQSGGWSIFGHATSVVMRLGSTVIMTRLLLPDVFGVMAIAIVVQLIVMLLADVGIQPTVIQSKRGHLPEFLNTAWTIKIIRGFLISLVCCLIAFVIHVANQQGLIAEESAYAAPVLPWVIAVISLESIFLGFGSTKIITARRDLKLGQVILLEFFARFGSVALTILLGWLTRSIWAFAIGMVFRGFLIMVISHWWLPGIRNRLCWDRESLAEFKNYGRWVLLSSGVYVLAMNGDRLLLGGWTDAATLGTYAIAFNLAILLAEASENFFSQVAMPAISEKHRSDPGSVRKVYFGVRTPFDIMLLAGAGFLFSTGQLIIDFLYDERYAAAGYMLQVLSCMLIFARYTLTCYAYLALGAPRNFFFYNLIKLVSLFVSLPLAFSMFGVNGVLWAVALHLAPAVPMVLWLNHRHKLNNFRYELAILLVWPVGYYIGEICGWLISYV